MQSSEARAGDERVARVLGLITERDLVGLRAAFAPLTDGQRREVAAAVEAWSRNLTAEYEQAKKRYHPDTGQIATRDFTVWANSRWPVGCVAVVGAFSAPAAAARTLLRMARQVSHDRVPAALMLELARDRGLTWLPDLAGRLADRLGEAPAFWVGLDEILRAYDAPVPSGDGFLIGWLNSARVSLHPTSGSRSAAGLAADQADLLQASPYLRDLLPRVFEADGAWRALEHGKLWLGLIELSRRESAFRPQLLDGCLRRILLGGTAPALRPFGLLWSELAADEDEVAARVAEYTALAGSAAPGFAAQALRALHALDGQGRLGLDDLLDLSAVVLARPEKAMVSAQLRALDRAAGSHQDRLPDILAAVEPASQHGVPAIRTDVARILRKHATSVAAALGEQLAAVADATDAIVRAEAAEERAASRIKFGPDGAGTAALPMLPVPPAVLPLRRPPVDTAERLEERLRYLGTPAWERQEGPRQIAVEEVLDGLVRLRVSPEVMAEVLPRLTSHVTSRSRLVLSLADDLAVGRCAAPVLLMRFGLLRPRAAEIAARLPASPVPRLVAGPTDTSGVIAPPALLDRLAAAEAEGWDPWPLDLDQALLRTTRDAPPELARQASLLVSPAGRRLARWWSPAPGDPALWDGLIGVLLSRGSDVRPAPRPKTTLATVPEWLAALPHHHEAVARWMFPLIARYDKRSARWLMDEDAMARLLLGAGAPGPGLRAVLAQCLTARAPERRDVSVAVLAEILARPGTDVAALGADLGTALATGPASLELALPGLACLAGAQPERMWPVVAAALPAVLAAGHAQAFRLVQVASDLAAHLGRADTVPGLAQAARGRSKLGHAAQELTSVLSPARR